MTISISDVTVQTADGKPKSLNDYKGNVLLIVNVASKCGNTPQYAQLEELNRKYAARGLRILGFPSNDFGGQEPGSSADKAGIQSGDVLQAVDIVLLATPEWKADPAKAREARMQVKSIGGSIGMTSEHHWPTISKYDARNELARPWCAHRAR